MSVRLVLAKGREKSLLRRHPWVFSGAVARMEGKASLGETIDIVDHQGKWLARGAYSPASQIRARVWTFDPSESIDIAFFSRRLQQAQKWRDWLAQKDGLDSYRLIAGESDGLPGITIDRFGNFLVLQLLSAGAEYQRAALISALQTLYPECSIYDRSDVAVRKKEGMELTQGPVTGELPPALLPIEEHGMKLLVDIQHGHKTGYYLDQRDSRLATRRYVENKRVLNCFSYTGGFAVSALMGGGKINAVVKEWRPAFCACRTGAQRAASSLGGINRFSYPLNTFYRFWQASNFGGLLSRTFRKQSV